MAYFVCRGYKYCLWAQAYSSGAKRLSMHPYAIFLMVSFTLPSFIANNPLYFETSLQFRREAKMNMVELLALKEGEELYGRGTLLGEE